MHFYIASGIFSEEERANVETVENVLKAKGHTFFSPMRCQLDEQYEDKMKWRTYTFRNDMAQLKRADAVIGILTKNYEDTGTVFEIGYAHGIAKPFFIYNPTGELMNLMATESTQAYLEGEDELKEYDFDKMEIKPYNKDAY